MGKALRGIIVSALVGMDDGALRSFPFSRYRFNAGWDGLMSPLTDDLEPSLTATYAFY